MSQTEEVKRRTKDEITGDVTISLKGDGDEDVILVIPSPKPITGVGRWLSETALEVLKKNHMAMLEVIVKSIVCKSNLVALKMIFDMASKVDGFMELDDEEMDEDEIALSAYLWSGR